MNHLFRTLGWSLVAVGLSGCAEMTGERVLYDQQGVQVGIQADPTISRSTPPARNNHPATLSPNELRLLLGSLQISGWSGTIVGLVQNPQPIPFLSPDELDRLADPIATALGQAGPTERVSFSLQNKERPYNPDRITGMLFIRGPYLHLVVTDHAAFIQADTGGGEEKDLRDTKGMKLWTLRPVQAAAVQSFEEPRWSPFETVHISLNINEAIALRKTAAPARADRALVPLPATTPTQLSPQTNSAAAPTATDDQRLQLRELTRSNLDLRERLDEQAKQMKELKAELARLQQEREKAKSKSRTPRKSPTP
ncbi:MAG: hypothetical protein NT179_01225 [Nitrospirae bacterium]|nr:hypothetical protein [Nitrospirota bacterium]